MHAITPPPVSHFDEMLTWSGASPSHLQSQFQTQLQHFGGATLEHPPAGQSQSQSQSQTLGPREHYVPYGNWLADTPSASLTQRRAQADLLFRRIGITFTVYGEEGGTERLIPSDVIPRIITADEWAYLEKGLTQDVVRDAVGVLA